MKFLFVIQGEGRGHMTQAIALADILLEGGHNLTAVCIGKSKRRQIPDFVYQNIKSPIHTFESPNFISDKKDKSINIGKTIIHNLRKWPIYKESLTEIDNLVTKHQPDVILNFYDILAGLYRAIYQPKCQFWTIGHQYLAGHPAFEFPRNSLFKTLIFKLNNKLTSLNADLKLALSFQPLPQTNEKTLVLPPLLRKEIRHLKATQHDFILAYTVNPGYGEEILEFSKANPGIKVEAFWDKKGAPNHYRPLPNLVFHQLNDRLFLEKMAACRGLITTAGFESVCEAIYLGKKVMMIPVKGQFEQSCNALDAINAGAGIQALSFDIQKFDTYLKKESSQKEIQNKWADQFSGIFKNLLEEKTALTPEVITNPHYVALN